MFLRFERVAKEDDDRPDSQIGQKGYVRVEKSAQLASNPRTRDSGIAVEYYPYEFSMSAFPKGPSKGRIAS